MKKQLSVILAIIVVFGCATQFAEAKFDWGDVLREGEKYLRDRERQEEERQEQERQERLRIEKEAREELERKQRESDEQYKRAWADAQGSSCTISEVTGITKKQSLPYSAVIVPISDPAVKSKSNGDEPERVTDPSRCRDIWDEKYDNVYANTNGHSHWEFAVGGKYKTFTGRFFIPEYTKSTESTYLSVKVRTSDGRGEREVYRTGYFSKDEKGLTVYADISGADTVIVDLPESKLPCYVSNPGFSTTAITTGLPDGMISANSPEIKSNGHSLCQTCILFDNYGNTFGMAYSNLINYFGTPHSNFEFVTNGKYSKFSAVFFIPRGASSDKVDAIEVIADGKTVFSAPYVTKDMKTFRVEVPISGCQILKVNISDPDNNSQWNLFAQTLNYVPCYMAEAGFYR